MKVTYSLMTFWISIHGWPLLYGLLRRVHASPLLLLRIEETAVGAGSSGSPQPMLVLPIKHQNKDPQ